MNAITAKKMIRNQAIWPGHHEKSNCGKPPLPCSAVAEAQATSDVKSAAADLATQMAEQVLAKRLEGAKADSLVDQAVQQLAGRLQ
jgi:hypothetical protein